MELDTLVSLHALLGALGLSSINGTERQRLLAAAEAASQAAARFAGRQFSPAYAQKKIAWTFPVGTPPELALPGDLLELVEVKNAEGISIMNEVQPLPESPPHDRIQARAPEYSAAQSPGEVTVTGLWAWHDRAPVCWVDSLDSVNTAMALGATQMEVADVNGTDAAGTVPRFSPGMLLRLDTPGDLELMRVIDADAVNQRLTVIRAVNGTSSAAHALGASIRVYTPPAEVAARVVGAAIALYTTADRGDLTPLFETHFEGLQALRRVRVR